MCKNAASTAATLMAAIEPTLVNLLTLLKIADTPEGQAAITAFNAAQQAVANWTPGTTAQNVVELINAFTQVFNTLPFPTTVKTLVDVVSAGIVTVLAVITGNSPAAASAENPEANQALHQAAVVHEATEQVATLVPGFKRSIWHSPTSQYKTAWNQSVDKLGGDYEVLKVA